MNKKKEAKGLLGAGGGAIIYVFFFYIYFSLLILILINYIYKTIYMLFLNKPYVYIFYILKKYKGNINNP